MNIKTIDPFIIRVGVVYGEELNFVKSAWTPPFGRLVIAQSELTVHYPFFNKVQFSRKNLLEIVADRHALRLVLKFKHSHPDCPSYFAISSFRLAAVKEKLEDYGWEVTQWTSL